MVVGSDLETHFLIYCPFHYNINTPACEVDKESGLFFCFSCQEAGNLIDFVMRSTGRNYFEACRLIDAKSIDYDFYGSIEKLIDYKEAEEFDISTINRLHENLLASECAKKYLYNRMITDESIAMFKLGYSEKQKMTTVPVQDHTGIYVGFVGRSIEGKSFKNSTGLPRRHILFNLNRSKYEKVTVVESSFDAIRLWQLGIPAVATLGSYISREQIELLNKWADSIIIIPDKDEAGEKLVNKIKSSLSKEINIIEIPEGKKDIGDLDDQNILELFAKASPVLI